MFLWELGGIVVVWGCLGVVCVCLWGLVMALCWLCGVLGLLGNGLENAISPHHEWVRKSHFCVLCLYLWLLAFAGAARVDCA